MSKRVNTYITEETQATILRKMRPVLDAHWKKSEKQRPRQWETNFSLAITLAADILPEPEKRKSTQSQTRKSK